jgi:hypothetical protein
MQSHLQQFAAKMRKKSHLLGAVIIWSANDLPPWRSGFRQKAANVGISS